MSPRRVLISLPSPSSSAIDRQVALLPHLPSYVAVVVRGLQARYQCNDGEECQKLNRISHPRCLQVSVIVAEPDARNMSFGSEASLGCQLVCTDQSSRKARQWSLSYPMPLDSFLCLKW